MVGQIMTVTNIDRYKYGRMPENSHILSVVILTATITPILEISEYHEKIAVFRIFHIFVAILGSIAFNT